jgi:hypothetical protein
MNRTLFHQISVLVYAAMLILSAEYVHAQTHGQIPMFVQPGTGACNNAGGNDCLDSLITQDSYLTIDARERYSLTTRDGVYARPTGSIALCIGALLGDQKDGGSYILNRAGDPKWKLQFIITSAHLAPDRSARQPRNSHNRRNKQGAAGQQGSVNKSRSVA